MAEILDARNLTEEDDDLDMESDEDEEKQQIRPRPQSPPMKEPPKPLGRPPLPGRERRGEEQPFFIRLRNFTPAEWEHMALYIYRTQPRRPAGRNPFIEKLAQPIDESYLKEQFGSGEYSLILNRVDPKNNHYTSIDRLTVEIEDYRYPPRIPDETWLELPINKRWAWAKKPPADHTQQQQQTVNPVEIYESVAKIIERFQPKTPKEREDLVNAVVPSVIAAMRDANKEAIEMVIKQTDAQSPDKVVGLIGALKELVKPNNPPSDPGSDKLFQVMLQQMKSSQDMVVQLLSTKKDEPPYLTKVVEKAIERLIEGEGRGGKHGWVDTALEMAPAILTPIADMVGNLVSLKTGQPPVRTAPMNPQTTPPNQRELPGTPAVDPRSFILQYGQVIMNAINSGMDGADFAETMVTTFGPQLHAIVSNMGKENVIAAMMSIPEFWTRVDQQAVDTFVDHFIRYREILAEGETGEEEEKLHGG
jgi:hypothetical protein